MKTFRAMGERVGRVLRRPRAYFAAAVPIAIPLLLAAVSIQPEFGKATSSSAVDPALRYDELNAPKRAELPEHSIILTFEKDDTLDGVLVSGGLTRGESAALTREFARFVDVRRLRPGHLVRFHYAANNSVDSVQMKMTGWGELEALRSTDQFADQFNVVAHPADLREIESTVSATIDSSLYEALRVTGETPQLMQQIVDVFQWDIDFFELKKGDSFSLVVKKKYADADLIGYGPISAARFVHGGVTYEAFRHEQADGRAGYYARAGTPLRKQFLRAPLKFTRITSGFSKRRFHPVLQYFRPHYGVDYGAPIGTPVMTTADGVVLEAGNKGGEGNYIRVRHTSRIDTCYLHLSRFAKGIKRGARVTQGQVIGYVGMTGLATGPHLDYRVNDNGKWLDPLKLRSITPDPLGGPSLRAFRAHVAQVLPRLALAEPQPRVAESVSKRRALF
ncbi:MAG TPA: peptidoglycan DD-metalloendopeptidase family protein [Thermoanaerobaculia bacterium]|nr:peptidoglycan DD-metalloendopeptidase family protein [Thermoanaerobaculia bacterium]